MSLTVPMYGFGGGGSGSELNFDVKDFRTEAELLASAGKENRIGVITSVPMTGWRFDANQPEDLQEGEVWISVGTDSPVKFNALKKNGIQVYPIFAKQYVDGAWVNVVAKSYQNSEWVEWVTEVYIFKRGVGATGTIQTEKQNNSSVSVSVDGITVGWSGSQGYTFSYAWSQETYDVTDFSKLVVESNFTDASTVLVGMKSGAGIVREEDQFSAYGKITKTGESIIEVDIQHLTGKHGFSYMGKARGTMYNVYLKK